jgi:protocatechuate 3,4-dioxygenase beta subunit
VYVNADESGCEDVMSVEVTVTVTPDIAITAQPQGGSICTGGNFDLSVTASGSPDIHYQWQSFDGTNWSDVGTDSPNYNTGALTATTNYRVYVNADESGCEDVMSVEVTVTVTPDIAITAQPQGGSICTGGNFDLSVTASGSPSIHYQWQSFDGTNWSNVGTDSPNYNTGILTATTDYRVFISAAESGCEDLMSVQVQVIVTPDIAISAQPQGGSICTGGNFDLSVTASGSPDIHYQWQSFDGTNWSNVGTDSPNYNTAILTSTTIYRVYVNADESGCEDVMSVEVTVTVTPDIAISAQPVGGSICLGGNWDLSVTASGSPDIHYQWQAFDGTNWSNVGTDSPMYNTGILNATTLYRVYVNADESGCEDVYSAEIEVTVFPDIGILQQPVGGSICVGGNWDLNIVANGSPDIHYQWEAFNGTSWSNVGTDSPMYNTGALSTTMIYRVFVNADEPGCEDMYSAEVEVTVYPDIAISAQPQGGSICTGGNFDLSVTASGSPDIHYQWQSFDGTTWSNVGADSPMYNTGALSATTIYRVYVNADESGCEDVMSVEVTVTVTPDIAITAQPQGGSICTGGNWDMSVTASGSPSIHYQWQSFDGTTWSDVGTDSPNYNTGILTATTDYRVFISAAESGCEDLMSVQVQVIVTPDIAISVQPQGGSICTGGNFDLSVTASGSPDIHYQWQSFNGTSWSNVGTDSPMYNTGVLTATTDYRVYVNADESGCEDVMSVQVQVIVTPDISISAQPVGGSICTGGNFDLSVTASGSPDIHYQWQAFTSSTWSNVGTDSPMYNTGALSATTIYRVYVNADESGCEDVMSAEVTVTVTPDISITTQPAGGSICTGGQWSLSVVAGGSPNLFYQWQDSTATGTWQNVSETGGTTSGFTTDVLTETTWYRVFLYANESGCEDLYSAAAEVLVVPDPQLTVSPTQTICLGGLGTVSVTVNGGVGSPVYQWQVLNGSWSNVSGGSGASYSTVYTTLGTFHYRVIVTMGIGCQSVSDTATIIVVDDPVATITASATQICTGGVVTITSSVSGSNGTGTYQWQEFVGSSWNNVGINNDTFITPVLTTGSYNYRLVYSQGSGCSDESNTVNIQVVNDPTASITGDNLICENESVVITATVTGGVAPYTYHWQLQQGADWIDVGSTQPTFNTGALPAGSYAYRLFVENGTGCNVTSNTFTITSAEHPVVTITAANNPICAGGNVAQFSSTVTGGFGSNTYQWQYNNPGTGWGNIGSNSANYSVSLPLGTFEYRLIVTQTSGCITVSDSYFMVVVPDPTVTASVDIASICVGGSATVTATVTNGSPAITFQWYSGPATNGPWTLISGATSSTYAVPSSSTGSTWYRVNTTDPNSGCSDPFSNSVQVTVVADPVVTISTMDDIYCSGETIQMTATVTGGTGTPHFMWQSYDGSTWSNVGTDQSTFNPGTLAQGNYQYRVTVTQASGCETTSSAVSFTVLDNPSGTLSSTPGSCGNNAGTITIVFPDNALATSIMFSIDGGANYFAGIPDNQGTVTYSNLAPGTYAVWGRWAPDECPVLIGSIAVNELACGSICGQVNEDTGQPLSNVEIRLYIDANNNDVYDSGETLFGTQYTDGDSGDYCFEDIPAGEYVVFEVQPANYNSVSDYDHTTDAPDTDGYPGANDPDDMIPVTVMPGEPDMDNNFVEDPFLGSISGNVSDDAGTNLPGVTVELYQDTNEDGVPDGPVFATTVTNGSGDYLFAGLEPVYYVVVEINPILYSNVSDYDHSIIPGVDPDGDDSAQGPDSNIPVNVDAGEADNDNDFVDGRPGTICGNVRNDVGQPLSNVEILLYLDVNNNDTVDMADVHLATQYTDGDSGDYCFEDVTPDEYVVLEIQPANYNSLADYDHSTGSFDDDGYPGANDPDNQIPVTVMPAEFDFNNDFIEDGVVGNISGYVQTQSGAPINNVSISLHYDLNFDGNPDGPALATTTTNSSGDYIFTGVEPGHYVLVEAQPANHSSISDYDHTTTPPDTDGNDLAQGPDNNIPVVLMPGEIDADNNFIDGTPGMICGWVKNDSNQPLSGVEIKLYIDINNNDSLDIADVYVTSTYTDGDTGDYCFEDVTPGEYVLFEVQPANYNSVSDYDHTTNAPDTDGAPSGNDPDNEIAVTVTPTEADMDNNFVEDPGVGSISGKVTNDANQPISSVEIRLHLDTNSDGNADGAPIATTFTNGSGDYIFTGVEPGFYVVIEITPLYHNSISDYDHSTVAPDLDGNDSAQGPDDNIPVQLMPGEADQDNNFKDGRPGTICGNVSDDTGAPISSVEIRLYLDINNNDSLDVADTLVATVFTDGDTGDYCFEDVTPAEYVILEIQPLNYNSLSDYDHTTNPPDTDGNDQVDGADDEIPVTLTPNEMDFDNDFIEDPLVGSISGHIEDDAGFIMVNVEVKLYNDTNADGNPDGAPIASAFTNGSGNYIFTGVEPGHYVLVEMTPLYYSNISDYDHTTTPPDTDGDDSALGADDNIPVFLMPAEEDEDNNFIDGRPGSICGNVSDDTGLYISSVQIRLYLDVNNNGIQDGGDVLVYTVYSDGDTGDYIFEDVTPGNYVIVEIQPANYNSVSDYDHTTTPPDTDGDDSTDGPDNQIPVTVLPAELDCENDFIEDPLPGSITGKVTDETNAAISGVEISLYADTNFDGIADGAALMTTTSNGSGVYSFTGIEPGFYVVVETNPASYSSISDYDHTTAPPDTDGNDSGQGADDDIPVRLLPGETDADNDFINGTPGLVCGSVLDDVGAPITGVELQLFEDVNNNDSLDIADILFATVYSDANTGNYCFEDVPPGEFVIFQVQPTNYYSVSDHDASTGAFDMDGQPSADDPDDEIAVTLEPNELDGDNNFVEDPFTGVISGFVLNDLNSGMPGVTVSLFMDTNGDGDADGSAIATTTTNGSGAYSFTNLEPDTYVVVESSPLYYLDMNDYDHSTSTSDPDGDDQADGPDNDVPVVLAPGETDADNNFVNGRPGMICGNVSDNIGQPISSVEIKLYLDVNDNDSLDMADVLVASLFSDGDTGDYCFEDLIPAEYVVVETQPVNFYSISDYDHSTNGSDPDGDDQADGYDDQVPVTLAPGEFDEDNDFIDAPYPGSITGTVLTEGGSPLNNVTIYLYADTNQDGQEDGSPLDTVTTNTSGVYLFTGVLPGYYVVVEVNPPYFSNISDFDASVNGSDTDGDDSASGPDNDIPVRILPAEIDADNNFVDGRPGRICGHVEDDMGGFMAGMEIRLYEDENGNGNMDPEDDMVAVEFTDAVGDYCFDTVLPGIYVINEVQTGTYGDAMDMDETPDPDGDDSIDGPDNDIPVEVTPNEDDFDNNFMDILCPGVPAISGFEIDTICSGESITFTAVDPNVGLVQYNWSFGSGSTPGVGTGIGPHTVSYVSNSTNSSTGAVVYLTITKEGCIPAEDSVANVIVNPLPVATIDASTTNLCYYAPRSFKPLAAEIPGYTYLWNFGSGANFPTKTGYGPHVIEWSTTGSKTVQLIIYTNAPGSSCGDTSTLTFNVVQCFGNITGRVRTTSGAGISGVNIRLFPDTNYDGLADNGSSPVRSVFTTSTGVYSMASLVPGQYVIVETQPAGYISIQDLDETNDNDTLVWFDPNDNIIPVTVEPQEIDADNVFIEIGAPGLITGSVFEDFDGDEVPDSGEGLEGIQIKLYKDDNTDGIADQNGFVKDTLTDGTGYFALTNVTTGSYVIVEVHPTEYQSVKDFDASNDNDIVPNTNTLNDTIPVTITNAETDANNYFIETIACTHVVNNTNDSGPGSLRDVIDCVEPGDTVTFHSSLHGQVIHLTSGSITIDKNIFIHSSLAAPRIMIYSDVSGAFVVPAGNSVEMKNIEITSGLGGVPGAAIENYGQLTIWDVCVFKNPLLPQGDYLIYNESPGEIIVKGACHIEE